MSYCPRSLSFEGTEHTIELETSRQQASEQLAKRFFDDITNPLAQNTQTQQLTVIEHLMPVGVIADVKVAEASETLAAGDYVNFWNDGGTEKVRLADQSNDRPAHGFVLVAVTATNNATVYFEGANTGLTGRTPGARQYLSTNGDVTETPQTTGLHQLLGVAISATEVNTDIQDCITIS